MQGLKVSTLQLVVDAWMRNAMAAFGILENNKCRNSGGQWAMLTTTLQMTVYLLYALR
jgi:hypothetical protein